VGVFFLFCLVEGFMASNDFSFGLFLNYNYRRRGEDQAILKGMF